ncbi:MAG: hypothetical protein QOG85_428 [Gaiellaceae bacterium]|jgi:hypothetical protein|nr:hypothetical protein [Gaiellaceae bacterium]
MFLIGIVITAVGFILALAVHPENPGSVNINTVGWILVVAGIVAFLADLLLWSSHGPGYLRRRTTVVADPGYGAAPAAPAAYPRRRVIEEEEAAPPPGPGY